MIVHIFASDKMHPAVASLQEIAIGSGKMFVIDNLDDLIGGDVLIAYHATILVPRFIYEKYKYRLVLHASKLPDGAGWSPLNWSILNGDEIFWLSLIEMNEKVDSGNLVSQVQFKIEPYLLFDQAMKILCNQEIKMIEKFLGDPSGYWSERKEMEVGGNYLRRRTPQDSEIDVTKSLLEQFNVFRASDNDRYPVFFRHLGNKYVLKIFRDESD